MSALRNLAVHKQPRVGVFTHQNVCELGSERRDPFGKNSNFKAKDSTSHIMILLLLKKENYIRMFH